MNLVEQYLLAAFLILSIPIGFLLYILYSISSVI